MAKKFKISYIKHENITLNEKEVKKLVKQYLKNLIGEDCYITKEGELEHWTSWPHGSGTTTDIGKPTKKQIAASILLDLF